MFACTLFGIDRQVYYRRIKRRIIKQDKAQLAVNMVLDIRAQMPRIGSKKLYYLLNKDLKTLKIGRDKFIDILRANHLLILPKCSYHITTNSHHRFRKYKNQLLDLQINKPEQVWVSDITYIGKRDKPCYLSLITDAYSKKIVGYNVSDNLNTESSLVALKLAVKQRKNKEIPLIHHSDRGLQYCANEYQKLLSKNNIKPSMTQNSDPYENAVAERINGMWSTIFAQQIIGAQGYKFIVTNGAQTREFVTANPRFQLALLSGGAAASTAYTIRVDVLYNSSYVEGTVFCTVTTSPAATRQTNAALDINEVNATPNPYAETFKLNLNTSSEDQVGVRVYDMLGREVESRQAPVDAITNFEIGSQYPSGVYNIIVTQGAHTKTLRVIKRQL